jgi:hypothetical protein
MSESPSKPSRSFLSRRRWLFAILIAAGMGLLLIVMCVGAYFLFKDIIKRGGDGGEAGIPLPVVKITATPGVSAPTPPPSPPLASSCETIISNGDVEIAASLPLSLTVGGDAFPVRPIISEDAGWSHPGDNSGSAVWVCGTVVNYVVVLEPTLRPAE